MEILNDGAAKILHDKAVDNSLRGTVGMLHDGVIVLSTMELWTQSMMELWISSMLEQWPHSIVAL